MFHSSRPWQTNIHLSHMYQLESGFVPRSVEFDGGNIITMLHKFEFTFP